MTRSTALLPIAYLFAVSAPAFAGVTDLAVLRTKLNRVATPADTIVITLRGAQVVPPNGSLATGTARLILNTLGNTLQFDITHSVSGETSAHFHGFSGPGVNAPIVFTLPLGTVKLGTWNFLEAQEPFIREELAYIDIHSVSFPGGEIRGQVETCVDKPAVQNFQTCLHVIVQNLGPDPYFGVPAFQKPYAWMPQAAVAGKLQISIDIDEPTEPNKPLPRIATFSLADSFAVNIAAGDSVDLDFGPVDYFPPRAGLHEALAASAPAGSNVDPNPANDQKLSFLVVLPAVPVWGPVGAGAALAAGIGVAVRRRRRGAPVDRA